uniref:creatininase family protein n=2 Tax=Oscillospiraceae TaxID=216572 RepID=UPI003AB5CE65
MFEEVKMERMTWREFEAKKDQVLILPVGATEQHGPHLPLCVDAVLAEQFACRLAQAVGGVVAPTLSYGYKSKPLSGGGPLFPGTIDLNGATLQQLASDLFDEFVRDGFTKIFIMNAHFENDP